MSRGSIIEDDELLYRNVPLRPEYFAFDGAGILRISSAAFGDRSWRTSLSRHDLCVNPPSSNPPRMQQDSAVAKLLAGQIREQGTFPYKSEGNYLVDVIADTVGQHQSHAVVVTNPPIGESNKRAFERLKERLSILFNTTKDWAIAPSDDFVGSLPRPSSKR